MGFYRNASALLAPGDWLANLDHTGRSPRWTEIHKVVLRRIVGPVPPRRDHNHQHPLPALDDHLRAIRAAHVDADVVWSTGRTMLLQGSVAEVRDRTQPERGSSATRSDA